MYPGFKPVSLTYLYVIRAREIKRGLLVKLTAKQAVVKGLWQYMPESRDTLRFSDPDVFETWDAAHAALCGLIAKSARDHQALMQRDLDLLAALGGVISPDAPSGCTCNAAAFQPGLMHTWHCPARPLLADEQRALNMGHSSNCATRHEPVGPCDCEDEG